MPRRKQLPEIGSAYAMPLKDGRFGVCRILRGRTKEEIDFWERDGRLVASCDWIGDSIPDANLPGLRSLLRLAHHNWGQQIHMIWTDDAPPSDFILIGKIAPTEEEASMDCGSLANWNVCQIQPLLQWRWDHDRENLLAEEKAEEAARLAEVEREIEEDRKRLAQMSLEQLTKRRFLPDWREYPNEKAKRAARKILRETAKQLLDIGKESTKRQKKAILKQCIEQFNRLDEQLDHFIETDEAEDIVDEFELIAQVCGISDENLADQWRSW